jgi:hypothetical protein
LEEQDCALAGELDASAMMMLMQSIAAARMIDAMVHLQSRVLAPQSANVSIFLGPT